MATLIAEVLFLIRNAVYNKLNMLTKKRNGILHFQMMLGTIYTFHSGIEQFLIRTAV